MPTTAWIAEAAEKALEWVRPIRVPPPGPPQKFCPFCSFQTGNPRELFAHLSSAHVGDRPVLLIDGREAGRSEEVYAALEADKIHVSNCTGIAVRVDGAVASAKTIADLAPLLVGQRGSRVEIDLENRFHTLAAPLHQTYVLDFFIPGKAELDQVDRQFSRHLASERLDFSAVVRFLESCPPGRPARRYAESLADYARGVLIKDRPAHVVVSVPYAEYRVLYQKAQSVLRHFKRPLPRLVCGAVHFALNDFGTGGVVTGFTPLDATATVLANLAAGDGWARPGQWPSSGADGQARCPIDDGISRVIALAGRLAGARKWTAVLEEECRQAAEAEALDVSDRHKVLALWAGTALRLEIDAAAQEPLAQLSASHPFDRWATKERERSAS